MRRIFLGAIISVLCCGSAFAQAEQSQQQQSAVDPGSADSLIFMPPAAAAQPSAPAKPGQPQPSAPSDAGSKDRLFFALPDFVTLDQPESIQPMTASQKFHLDARGTFDPAEFAFVGVLAAFSQAQDADQGFGQGAAGYGKRYGATLLDSIDENFMVGAIFPTLLKEDPRYFQLGKGGFWRRAEYSVSRSFITRTDSGHSQFNFSEFLGSAVAAAVGTTYRTASERTASDAAADWGAQIGWDTMSNFMREFWPDVRRQLHRNS
jgi:hypothetical protein